MVTARADVARRGSRLGEVLLTLLAVLGVTCLAALLAALVFNVKPIVFRSGSMAPTMPAGALALVKQTPAAQLKAGDVVMVRSQSGMTITHRIVGTVPAGNQATLTLKGDANKTADVETYTVRDAGRVIWSAPGMGSIVAFAQSTPFIFLTGVALGALGVVIVRPRNGRRHEGRAGKDGRTPKHASATAGKKPSQLAAGGHLNAEHIVSGGPVVSGGPAVNGGPAVSGRPLVAAGGPATSRIARRAGAGVLAVGLVAAVAVAGADGVSAAFSDAAYSHSVVTREPNGKLVGWRSNGALVLSNQYRAQAYSGSTWTTSTTPNISIDKTGSCPNLAIGWSGTQGTVRQVSGTGQGTWSAAFTMPISPAAASCYAVSSTNYWVITDGTTGYYTTNPSSGWTAWTGFPSGVKLMASQGNFIYVATDSAVFLYGGGTTPSGGGTWFTTTMPAGVSGISALTVSNSQGLILAGGTWYLSQQNGGTFTANSSFNAFGTTSPPTFLGGNGNSVFVACNVDRTCQSIPAAGGAATAYPVADL